MEKQAKRFDPRAVIATKRRKLVAKGKNVWREDKRGGESAACRRIGETLTRTHREQKKEKRIRPQERARETHNASTSIGSAAAPLCASRGLKQKPVMGRLCVSLLLTGRVTQRSSKSRTTAEGYALAESRLILFAGFVFYDKIAVTIYTLVHCNFLR